MPFKTATTIFQSHTQSPLGEMLMAASSQGLVGVWFVHHQAHRPDTQSWVTENAHPTLLATAQQLQEYFEGHRQQFELPLQPAWGTPFQQVVWHALQRIPFGQTRTYGDLAHGMGKSNATRAVGAAIGQNPHSIVVPCHRVVGADGSLTGFAGGLDRKKYLLAHEASHT